LLTKAHLLSARPIMRWTILLVLLALPVGVGCGEKKEARFGARGAAPREAMDKIAVGNEKEEAVAKPPANEPAAPEVVGANFEAQGPNQPAKEPKVEQPRKIKYSANLVVVVTDFDKAWDGLKDAIKLSKGFSAKEEIQGSAGTQRTGSWTIRVPVD